ncbi:MAG TPA: 2-dehydropantoate 2-reductase [Actinomycetota bacterium]|nr:2-dehydropantoate 2-reductase [Actinomycetota bacterium]
MRIAIFGAGAIGGYYGGRLAQAGFDVHLIARGEHLAALRSNGLVVRSVRGDFTIQPNVHADAADIGPCDVILFCVKTYDIEEAAAQLTPLLHEGTTVISLQNGVDNAERISRVINRGRVLGGAAYIFASITEPGVIVDAGGPGALVFGGSDPSEMEWGRPFLEACVAANITADLVADIRTRLWEKFVLICALAGMTATTRVTIGEIRNVPASYEMFRRIAVEVQTLAQHEGVVLPDDTADRIVGLVGAADPEGRSSLYLDVARGRRLELESLHGYVVRRSRAHGIQSPMNEAVYAILKPHDV